MTDHRKIQFDVLERNRKERLVKNKTNKEGTLTQYERI